MPTIFSIIYEFSLWRSVAFGSKSRLAAIRRENPKYKIELLQGSLIAVHPAHETADPPGTLYLRLREFFLPPDVCVAQQLLNMDERATECNFMYLIHSETLVFSKN